MLKSASKIYFVGVGGIGISALARLFVQQGKDVSGADAFASEITASLSSQGVKIFIGHKRENLPGDAGLLIYSSAVPESNTERMRAKELGIKQLSYPQALGEFSRDYKVIAIAGTNGKTTTTAMIGWIMEAAGLDPTVIVGSKVLAWNSNARLGKSQYLVLEADEYRRAFLNYEPDIAVITNVEADHLDYYKDIDDIKDAFKQFVANIKPGGKLVKFGTEMFQLRVPGKFNQDNAAAAAAVARALDIPESKIKNALESFSGTWRRFETVGKLAQTVVISDYAHHPSGVRGALSAANEVYGDKVLTVFQPHQHNRTKKLFRDFVSAFCESSAKNFIISEIFDVAGREETKDQDISSQDLVAQLQKCGKNAEYSKDLVDCERKIRDVAENYDMILIMGAGDVYKVAEALVSAIPGSNRDPGRIGFPPPSPRGQAWRE